MHVVCEFVGDEDGVDPPLLFFSFVLLVFIDIHPLLLMQWICVDHNNILSLHPLQVGARSSGSTSSGRRRASSNLFNPPYNIFYLRYALTAGVDCVPLGAEEGCYVALGTRQPWIYQYVEV